MVNKLLAAIAVLIFALQGSVFAADDHAAKSASDHGAAATAHSADPSHGADAEHSTPNLIPMKTEEIVEQAPLAIWSFVVFMVLLALATKFGWKPIVKAMHDREHHMEACLHDTEKARNEAEGLLRQYKAEMASASEKIKALLDEARRDAQTTSESIISKAQAESELLKDRAHKDISQARDEALTDIWSKASELSVRVAAKVLQKNMTEEDHRRLLDLASTELPDQSSFNFRTTTGSTR